MKSTTCIKINKKIMVDRTKDSRGSALVKSAQTRIHKNEVDFSKIQNEEREVKP